MHCTESLEFLSVTGSLFSRSLSLQILGKSDPPFTQFQSILVHTHIYILSRHFTFFCTNAVKLLNLLMEAFRLIINN